MSQGSSLFRAALLPVPLLLLSVAAGCLTASDQSRLRTDMADVRQQVFDMKKSTAEILERITFMEEALSRQEGASPTRFADLEALLQSLTDQVRALGARLDDNTARMATLAQEIALARQQYRSLDARLAAALATRGLPAPGSAPGGLSDPSHATGLPMGPLLPPGSGATADPNGSGGPEGPDDLTGRPGQGAGATPETEAGAVPPLAQAGPVSPPPPGTGTGAFPGSRDTAAEQMAFREAYADYTRGSYESALMGFQEFLKNYPGSPLAEGAQYYAGDCLFSQQRYDEAASAFTQVIERYPASDKAPAAHLKKGLSLLAMKQTARGVIQLQHVIETYPRSDEARLARERLRQLGLSVR